MAHPFIPVANTALVELVYTFGGQIIENTFHVEKSTPFTFAQLQALATAFDLWDSTGATRWQTVRPIGCTLIQIKTKGLDSAAAPLYWFTLPTPRNGAVNINPMPGNVTFCVTLQTGLAGRSQRGRVFMPGLWTTIVGNTPTNNVISAAQANAFVVSLNALIAQIAALGSGHQLVVTSYRTGNAWRSAGSNTPITNAAYADLAIDTQRRRLP